MAALINSIDELKDFIPASVTLDFKDIKPKIRLVERETVKRIFSTAIYTRLTTEAGDSADDTEVKSLLSEAVAHLALLHYLAFGQVQISSAGIQIASNAEMKQAFEWQIEGLRKECSIQGWAAIESALEYLEGLTTGELFTAWAEAPFHTAAKTNLISTLRQFEKYASLHHSRVLFNKLSPVMADQQEQFIIPALGQTLWDIMMTPGDSSPAKKTLLAKLKDLTSRTLVYQTMAVGFQDTLLILSDNGPMIIDGLQSGSSDAKASAPADLLSAMALRFSVKANAALTDLLALCQDSVAVLPEYKSSANFISIADQTDHIPRNDPESGMIFL